MGFKNLIGGIKMFASKHTTAITVGVSLVGYGLSVVTAIRETRSFDSKIEELRINNNGKEPEKKEIVLTALQSYWPTAVIFAISTTSLIMGQRAAYKKTMALSTAYSLMEKSFTEYKKEVEKTLTDKKKVEIDQNVDEQKAKKITKEAIEVAEHTGNGDTLCMERWTGRMFYSDPVVIEREFNRVNGDFVNDSVASLNQLLDAWGLRTRADDIGECLGWRMDIMGEAMRLKTSSTLTSDNIPVLVVGTEQFPDYDYSIFRGF